jgi:hypothetical protein
MGMKKFPSVALDFAAIPDDKSQVKSHGREKEYPVPGPVEVSLKQRGDPVGTPESQRHQHQAQHSVNFAFDPSDTSLNFIVHGRTFLRSQHYPERLSLVSIKSQDEKSV